MRFRIKGTLLAILICLVASPSLAQIQGDCADCHTMHNSEQGQAVAVYGIGADPATAGHTFPIQSLLRMDCIACHAQNTPNRIVTMPGGSTIPQVYHQDSTDLAAGNFRHIADGGNRKGHNVVDVVPAESDMTFPPGFRHANAEIGAGGFDLNAFTCAGAMGCHGYRGQILSSTPPDPGCNPEFEECGTTNVYRTGISALSGMDGFPTVSMKRGAHHNNYDGVKHDGIHPNFYDSPLAHSYRFIRSLRGYGNEIDRWQNIDENSHNEYVGGYEDTTIGNILKNTDFGTTATCSRCHVGGEINTISSRLTTPGQSMSGFCLTCHGSFHSSGVTNGTSGAFLRHPSDYVIPNRDEYAGYTVFDVTAPVARPHNVFVDGMSASPTVNPGTDLVMCLSCHVAHASPYDGMLRFDYQAMTAGFYADVPTAQAEGGCLACHTAKGVAPQNR